MMANAIGEGENSNPMYPVRALAKQYGRIYADPCVITGEFCLVGIMKPFDSVIPHFLVSNN
jgi:hypothetical protein